MSTYSVHSSSSSSSSSSGSSSSSSSGGGGGTKYGHLYTKSRQAASELYRHLIKID